jgi:hypothetical protein
LSLVTTSLCTEFSISIYQTLLESLSVYAKNVVIILIDLLFFCQEIFVARDTVFLLWYEANSEKQDWFVTERGKGNLKASFPFPFPLSVTISYTEIQLAQAPIEPIPQNFAI